MLEYREDASDGLVEIVVDGRVSKAEFDEIATRLEAAIARHGKLRVLEEVRSFGGIDPSAFWADLKFGLRHLNHFSRCAVISDQRWIEVFARGVDKLLQGGDLADPYLEAYLPNQRHAARDRPRLAAYIAAARLAEHVEGEADRLPKLVGPS